MQLFHSTFSELKDALPVVRPFVGQMIAVQVGECATELYVVSKIVEAASVVWVTYKGQAASYRLESEAQRDVHRTFSKAQWEMLEKYMERGESFAKRHYPGQEPSLVDGAFFSALIDVDGLQARLYHRVDHFKRKNELVLIREPVSHHLIDGVANVFFSVEVLSLSFGTLEFVASHEYQAHLGVLKARFRHWWSDKVHPVTQLPPPLKASDFELRLPPRHKDLQITQKLLESIPPLQPKPKFRLGDEVLVTYEGKEQPGVIISSPVSIYESPLRYQVRLEGNRYVSFIKEYQMRFAHETPPKKLPTPLGVDVAPDQSKSTLTVYDDKEIVYDGPVADCPVKFTGTKDHKIVREIGPIEYHVAELQPGNAIVKSMDEWDNPVQPVEDKNEGDAMMEFFKGGKS